MRTHIGHDNITVLENAGAQEPSRTTRRVAGRGAVSNPAVRFDARVASPFDDGWDTLVQAMGAQAMGAQAVGELPRLDTSLIRDTTRSAISWNNSPDIGFDRAVNPYRGCEHGCIYCYARPTHAYLGYSPGLDFETRLVFKPDVADLLEKELRKPGYAPRTLALGSNTDPYQPIERTLKLTRSVLEVLDRYNHPVGIVTKSAGVLRDLDILTSMAQRNLVRVHLSITTLDPRLARIMEPRAATPARRLQAVAELARARVPVGVLVAPMIPALNDAEMEKIMQAAFAAGARHAGYILLRLPLELRQMFEDWLHTHFPDRARHVLSLVRQSRSGELNDPRFHHRVSGQGAYADLLGQRFAKASGRLGFDEADTQLDCSRFAVPAAATAECSQMSLF
jgi:DNA repair photolyase